MRWGSQLDVQQLSSDDDQRSRRASYLAKYTTKSTEQAGGLLHPIGPGDVDHAQVRPHVRGYLRTAYELHHKVTAAIGADEASTVVQRQPAPATSLDPTGLVLRMLAAISTRECVAIRLHDRSEHIGQITRRTPDGFVLDTGAAIALAAVRVITTPAPPAAKRDPRDRRLGECAHAFGYRGHCLTKSRRWSTTFKELRAERERHVHEHLLATSSDHAQRALAQLAATERIAAFEFVGVGHLTTADAYLAAQAAARAREQRQLAREALDDHHKRREEDRCEATRDQTRAT